jgi:tRNA dimethylallyltransferase
MSILTIVGPTAVGKTGIAVLLAERISGEIVSADSRQIYKYLNIGTAKPTAAQRKNTPHHLVDFVEPDKNYSCGQFGRDAERAIDGILQRNKTPIVCGGTGLYIRALFHPLDELPQSSGETKKKLHYMLKRYGIDHMYKKLMRIDPAWAERIKPQDKQRIMRGIEVYEITGRPLSEMMGKKIRPAKYLPYYTGLRLHRDVLYARINARFEQMLAQGLVNETIGLLKRGLDARSSALRTIGYKEIVAYLEGKMSLDEASERAKRRTRNYAKRQLTWFNKIPDIVWYDADDPELIDRILKVLKRSKIV